MESKLTYDPTQGFNACWKMIINKLMQSNSPHNHGAIQLLSDLTRAAITGSNMETIISRYKVMKEGKHGQQPLAEIAASAHAHLMSLIENGGSST